MNVLADRVVVVTGAAGSLGGVLARALPIAGARMVLVDRLPDRLGRRYPELAGSERAMLVGSVDLTDAAAVVATANAVVKRFGRIDGLVCAAGGFRGGMPLAETSPADWDLLLDVNARSAFNACRAVAPHMVRQGWGRIVNVAARAALAGAAGLAVYSAAKSAVLRLTEALADELRESGITVNAVLPGTIDTPANRAAMPAADPARWVAPEAVADVIVFLLSDAARAVTGAAIPVAGRG